MQFVRFVFTEMLPPSPNKDHPFNKNKVYKDHICKRSALYTHLESPPPENKGMCHKTIQSGFLIKF